MNNVVGSIMLSWCYDSDGKGVVIMGLKDPMSIDGSRIDIKQAWTDEEGLEKLKGLGIDI